MAYDYLEWGVGEFKTYITDRADDIAAVRQRSTEFTHLQDYFALWLEEGNAAGFTGGRFDTFLRIMIRVIDEWARDPTLGGAVRHPVDGILELERSGSLILDPAYFGAIALQRQIGRSPYREDH